MWKVALFINAPQIERELSHWKMALDRLWWMFLASAPFKGELCNLSLVPKPPHIYCLWGMRTSQRRHFYTAITCHLIKRSCFAFFTDSLMRHLQSHMTEVCFVLPTELHNHCKSKGRHTNSMQNMQIDENHIPQGRQEHASWPRWEVWLGVLVQELFWGGRPVQRQLVTVNTELTEHLPNHCLDICYLLCLYP